MNFQAKRKKLEDIESEVNDLHPVLQRVLQELPDVRSVEYCQGPNEKGADFVVTRIDNTLDQQVYTGCVVKRGRIHQDLTQVERQIEECLILERYLEGGKRKVRLDEVWVISTGRITQNAKEKIHVKYSTAKIHFIDNTKLIKWIDDYAPYFWNEIESGIGASLQSVASKMQAQIREGQLIEVSEDLYIPLDLLKVENNYAQHNGKRRKPKPVGITTAISRDKCILIESQMGGGKSRMLQEAVIAFAQPESVAENHLIPVYVSYRDLINVQSGSITRAAHDSYPELDAWFDENDANQVVVVVDGIDEVLADQSDGVRQLINIVREVQQDKRLKLVLATRQLAILEEEPAIYRVVTRYSIPPLSLQKLKKFIDGLCDKSDIPSRIIDDLKKSDLFQQLPQSPIAAILLSRLLRERYDLPSNIAELYAQAFEVMLGRWDIGKGLISQQEYEAADKALGRLCGFVIDNNLDRISKAEAYQIFDRYLTERNLPVDSGKLFDKVIQRSGILAFDAQTSTVRFRHRSFAEFGYAKDAVTARSLSIDRRIYDPYWEKVFFFYVGLLKDCEGILKDIYSCPTQNEFEEWAKVFNMPGFLLAGFSSPYRVTEENLYKLFLEAGRLFSQVRKGKTNTKLDVFPEMHALWIVQYIIRNAYSFQFFKKAMETTALKLKEEAPQGEGGAFALFFLGLVAIDLNEREPFELLFEKFDIDGLPLSVAAALECEAHMSEELGRSYLLRKHSKKLRKLVKNSRSVGDHIRNLFENPIRPEAREEARKELGLSASG